MTLNDITKIEPRLLLNFNSSYLKNGIARFINSYSFVSLASFVVQIQKSAGINGLDMKIKIRLFSILLAALTTASPTLLLAQNSVSFEEIEKIAFDNSLLVKQLQATVLKEKAESQVIKTLDNPELSAEFNPYLDDPDSREVEYDIYLSQPLKASSFGARSELAELKDRLIDLDSKLSLTKFSQELLLAYSKLWVLQERKTFLDLFSKRLKNLATKLTKAKQAGAISLSSEKILESQRLKVLLEQESIEADLLRAKAELLEKTGSLPETLHLKQPDLNNSPQRILLNQDSSMLQQRILLTRDLARQNEKLASLDAYPNFAPRIGFGHTADGDDRIMLGFSMALPFFDRNQAQTAKSQAESIYSQAETENLSSGKLQQQLDLLQQSSVSMAKQSLRYKTELLPLMDKAYLASEKEFEAGQATLMQVWQVLYELDQAQIKYFELWLKALSAQVELTIILGKQNENKTLLNQLTDNYYFSF